METLHLVGFVLMLILVILAILTIKLIGFEIHIEKIHKHLKQVDEQLNNIEKNSLPD